MDSELKAKISELAFGLAEQEQQRLEAAGTFVELEQLASEIGDEFTRQLMTNQLTDRSNEASESAQPSCCPDCGGVGSPGDPYHRQLDSTRGELSYHEPTWYCPACRRSFFPGGRSNGFTGSGHSDTAGDSTDGLGRS